MAKKGGAGENSKKAAGQARKAEQAAGKAAAENAKKAALEDADWDRGAKKGNAKKAAAEDKKAEDAKKKAERDALLAEEEANTPGRAAPKNAKSAVKKTRGIDAALGQVDAPLATLNATGIENAIDAMGLVDKKSAPKIDRHPEKRIEAAWKAFWEQRWNELQAEGWHKIKGNSRNKAMIQAQKDFDKSPENPKRQMHASYNATKDELAELRSTQDAAIEKRLTEKR